MKNIESTFKKDLEHLYANVEERFIEMYDSELVHYINLQLEKHLGHKLEKSEIDALEIEKLPGSSLLYKVSFHEENIGFLSISRDRHNYKLLLHFK